MESEMASQDNRATGKPGNKINHLISSLQLCYHHHYRAVLYHIYPGKFLTMWIQKAKSAAEYSPQQLIIRINGLHGAERGSQCISWLLPPHCAGMWDGVPANHPPAAPTGPAVQTALPPPHSYSHSKNHLQGWRHNPEQYRAEERRRLYYRL